MAEVTIAIPYRPLSKNAAGGLCIFWGLVELAALGCFMAVSGQLHPIAIWLLLILGAAISAYPPFVIISFYFEAGSLIADRDGLVMPPGLWGFGKTVSIKWKDVTGVDFYRAEGGRQSLLLNTQNSGLIKIAMSAVPPESLEKLLLAMEMWLPGQVWSDRAIAQRDGLQISSDDASFTQLWESELRRRYSATTFIPHDPGAKITDGLTVLKQIAFGGFSAVYLAENDQGEKVIVKELVVQSSDLDMQTKAEELFGREAKLLAKLEHPQIARVFDHFVKDGHAYLVLENIEGENLRQYVRRLGPGSEEWVWRCASQMAQILQYLHSRQPPIIHRDFTPENIVIGSTGRLTLIDFGAANEYTSAATGTLVGKQAYMPVEQIRGKAEPRSDLYALGCVLYWLLTGLEAKPLSVCHPGQIKTQIRPALDALVARLTALEPGERFASAADLLAHIEQNKVEVPGRGNGQ